MANGRPVKASYDVKVGDLIEIQFGQKTLKVEVLVVADNVRKDDAPAMYKEILGLNRKRTPAFASGVRSFAQGSEPLIWSA